MIDAAHECPRCGDPGPPVIVRVPLNPDAPAWDLWMITLWQCRVCLTRYPPRQRAIETWDRVWDETGDEELPDLDRLAVFRPRRKVITLHAPGYLEDP